MDGSASVGTCDEPPPRSSAAGTSLVGRRSNLLRSRWSGARRVGDWGRAELIMESADPEWLMVGEAIAEVPKPMLPSAAAAIITRKAPATSIDMDLNLSVANMLAAVFGVCT